MIFIHSSMFCTQQRCFASRQQIIDVLHQFIDVLASNHRCFASVSCMHHPCVHACNTHKPSENIAPLIYIFRFFPIATPEVTTSMISPMSLAAIKRCFSPTQRCFAATSDDFHPFIDVLHPAALFCIQATNHRCFSIDSSMFCIRFMHAPSLRASLQHPQSF
jgi:hypothetical protein